MKSGSNKYIAYDNFVAFKNSSTCENMQVINLNQKILPCTWG